MPPIISSSSEKRPETCDSLYGIELLVKMQQQQQQQTFRENLRHRAKSDYRHRKSKANPFSQSVPCLKVACSKLSGDYQPRNRLANNAPDFKLQAYDPIQTVRRVNFLKRRPMLLASQPSERAIVAEVPDMQRVLDRQAPKLEKFEQPRFEPKEIALLKLPIGNKGSLAKELPSIQDLKSVQEQNEADEVRAKLKRFQTRFQKVFIHDEYVKGVRENSGIQEPYTGLKPYIPRPKTPKPSPYEPLVVQRQPVDELKFRRERLDYFHFPVDACPMRDYLKIGQTWMGTHIEQEPKWMAKNMLQKTKPRPFPNLEDVSFSRYPRPRTPYSRFLTKVASELRLSGPFDEMDNTGKVVDEWAEQKRKEARKVQRANLRREKTVAAREVEQIDDGRVSQCSTTSMS